MRHFEASTANVDGEGMQVAVVASRYNQAVTDALMDGALAALREAGVADDDIDVLRVPGAFELPVAMKALLDSGDYDCAVALGCVIRGDTPHFEFVARGATDGLMRVMLDSGIPVGFGLLTVENQEQANERCRPDETNKGREAALSALAMAEALNEI